MNYTTVEKIRVYLLKHESELDPELQDIFEEVIGRKPKSYLPLDDMTTIIAKSSWRTINSSIDDM